MARPILLVSVILTVISAAMWALAGDLTAVHRARDMMALDRSGAVFVSAVTVMCWLSWRRDARERDRSVLIRTLARTVPMDRAR